MSQVIKETDWFEVGRTVFKEDVRDPDSFPPLHDMEAQRQWLGGFGAAWAEAPNDDGSGESVNEALVRALEGKEDLLPQLRSHASRAGSRTVH